MNTIWIVIIIAFAEFLWSYLADMMTISVVSRKKWKAVSYSVASLALNYGVLKVIAQHDWNNWMIGSSIVGVACGTYLAAARRPRKKRKTLKRLREVTTA